MASHIAGPPIHRERIAPARVSVVALAVFAVAALVVPSRTVTAQPATGWTPQQSGTTKELKAVDFTDPSAGFAVGTGGTILATTDGGQTWKPQFACAGASPCRDSSSDRITADLHGVAFGGRSTGFVVGAGGTILATTNGGRRWNAQFACGDTSPCQADSPDRVTTDLNDVESFDGQTAYAVGAGGTILSTTDGGRRWTRHHACAERPLSGPAHLAQRDTSCTNSSPDRVSATLAAVSSPHPSYAFAVGAGGTIMRTQDTGRTWLLLTACPQPPCGGVASSTLQVRNGQLVYVPEPPAPAISADLTAVSFIDTMTGRAVGADGTILSTIDAGLRWDPEHACSSGRACDAQGGDRITADLLALAQPDQAQARAVGRGGSAISWRRPGPWASDPISTDQNLQALSFPDANTGFAVGAGGIILGLKSPPPDVRVSRIEPARGFTAGGTNVTISGTGLSGVTGVNFSSVPASGVNVESDTRVVSVVPRGAPGPVDITVTTPAGSSSLSPGARFTYVAPSGGSWRPTRPCEGPCAGAGAPLGDGRVLVAGTTVTHEDESAATEIYDPATDTWSTTDPLNEPRVDHSVTALRDGRVLVIGGRRRNPAATRLEDHQIDLASAEIYDPSNGTWRQTAPMPEPRRGHTATVLSDGKVLVVGGCCRTVDAGAPGGPGPALDPALLSPFLRSALVYDPASDAWSPAGEMAVARILHSASLLRDGVVLVAGGSEHTGPSPAPAELYDAKSNKWTKVAALGVPRASHTATVMADGTVMVAGGNNGSAGVRFAEVFDPRSRKWSPTGNLAVGRYDHSATRLPDGSVLVAGGSSKSGSPLLDFAELYDPGQQRWKLVSSLPGAVTRHSATLIDKPPCGSACGKVLIAGGTLDTVAHLYTPPAVSRQSGAGGGGGGVPLSTIAIVAMAAAAAGLGSLLLVRRRRRDHRRQPV